jgi:predicted HTH domain antitoxin
MTARSHDFLTLRKGAMMSRLLRFECEIPDAVFDEEFPEDRFVQSLKEDAIIKLFRAERLSSGYAAKLLGITRRDFFERLEQHGVALAAYTETDLVADLDTLDRLEPRGQDKPPELGG